MCFTSLVRPRSVELLANTSALSANNCFTIGPSSAGIVGNDRSYRSCKCSGSDTALVSFLFSVTLRTMLVGGHRLCPSTGSNRPTVIQRHTCTSLSDGLYIRIGMVAHDVFTMHLATARPLRINNAFGGSTIDNGRRTDRAPVFPRYTLQSITASWPGGIVTVLLETTRLLTREPFPFDTRTKRSPSITRSRAKSITAL